MGKFKFSLIYILTVVAINIMFTYVPNIELFDGQVWSIGSVVAGMVFVARDFAQREVGSKPIILLMVVAGAISYQMADPFVAMASISAFAISETVDYVCYSVSRGSFRRKVVISSLVSVPIDTFVFLTIIDSMGATGFVIMSASKLIALSYLLTRRQLL